MEQNSEAILDAFGKNVEDVFTALFQDPLSKMKPDTTVPHLLVIDALDELPDRAKDRVLNLLTAFFSKLPPWLRLFVTSRPDEHIKSAFAARYDPFELLVDEKKNRADVRAFLRERIARSCFKHYTVDDLDLDVFTKFKADLRSVLADIKKPFERSIDTYTEAIRQARSDDEQGYQELLKIDDRRPDVRQPFKDFKEAFRLAAKAQEVLKAAFADQWSDPDPAFKDCDIRHPVDTARKDWMHKLPGLKVDEPGLKARESAQRKLEDKLNGEAFRLTDLARITIKSSRLSELTAALRHLEGLQGWKIEVCKNKYKYPSPLGYRDINVLYSLPIDGERVLVEVQFHIESMIEAKKQAHGFYEIIRKKLPVAVKGTKIKELELQEYVNKRLTSSQVDAAVDQMEQKADGLFIYARLLQEHAKKLLDIKREVSGEKATLTFQDVTDLPDGLDDLYMENFKRVFGKDEVMLLFFCIKLLVILSI